MKPKDLTRHGRPGWRPLRAGLAGAALLSLAAVATAGWMVLRPTPAVQPLAGQGDNAPSYVETLSPATPSSNTSVVSGYYVSRPLPLDEDPLALKPGDPRYGGLPEADQLAHFEPLPQASPGERNLSRLQADIRPLLNQARRSLEENDLYLAQGLIDVLEARAADTPEVADLRAELDDRIEAATGRAVCRDGAACGRMTLSQAESP